MKQSTKLSKRVSTLKLDPGPLSSQAKFYLALGNITRLQILEACAKRAMTQKQIDQLMGGNMKYHVYLLQEVKLLKKFQGELYLYNKTNLGINRIIDCVTLCLNEI